MILSNVNIGTAPSAGDGDPLRTAFIAINNNFQIVKNNVNALTNSVTSVAGRTGNIILTTQDIVGINNYASSTSLTTANIAMKGYVDAKIAANVAALVDSAPGILDTLNELAAALNDDANFSSTVVTLISNTNSNITLANTTMKAYVDGQITAANTASGTANIGMLGYVDQANTIQTAYINGQISAANAEVTAANVGMRGYVDSQSFYSNTKVASYLPTYSGNIGANISKAGYTWTFGSDGNLTLPRQLFLPNGTVFKDTPDDAVGIGNGAGYNTQGAQSVAIGREAAETTQGAQAVAIGVRAGQNSQGQSAVAIGNSAGNTSQGSYATAVGINAGKSSQGVNATAIGNGAGETAQGADAVAVGVAAGGNAQSSYATAVGVNAGQTGQGLNATAIGNGAGQTTQGADAVAVGVAAGNNGQGAFTVAIGSQAGQTSQGTRAIAIGYMAGRTNQSANSIAINSSLSMLYANVSGLFINPVRQDDSNVANIVYYNTSTKEMTYGPAVGSTYSNVQVATYLPTYTGVVTASNVAVDGNVTATYFVGNGALLTGIVSGAGNYGNIDVKAFLETDAGPADNFERKIEGYYANLILGDDTKLYSYGSSSTSYFGHDGFANININYVRAGQGDIQIGTNNGASTWTFDNTGNLTLPGATAGETIATSGGYITVGNLLIGQGGSLFNSNNDSWALYGNRSDAGTSITIPSNDSAGNGQPITIENQISNVEIVSGNNTWTFDVNANLTLPAGGVIAEGGGITGAIRLTPAGGANANQALLIYPTAAGDGDHVHLTAGGGSTELYLGNDLHYVKLVNGGNVELRATTANLSPQASWTFDTTGNIDTIQALGIKVPNGVPSNVAVINSTTGSWEINPQSDLATTGGTGTGLTVNVTEAGGYASTIEIATAGTGYTNGDLITVTSGTSNATFTIVIGGRNSWQFGTDGNLTLPAGGQILDSTGNLYASGSSYSNVQVAAYLASNITLGMYRGTTNILGNLIISTGTGDFGTGTIEVSGNIIQNASTTPYYINTTGNLIVGGNVSIGGNVTTANGQWIVAGGGGSPYGDTSGWSGTGILTYGIIATQGQFNRANIYGGAPSTSRSSGALILTDIGGIGMEGDIYAGGINANTVTATYNVTANTIQALANVKIEGSGLNWYDPALEVNGYVNITGNIDVYGRAQLGNIKLKYGTLLSDTSNGEFVVGGNITAGNISASGTSGKLGYTNGGFVQQITANSNGVSLNTVTGNIQLMDINLGVNGIHTVALTNNKLEETDLILVSHHSGGVSNFAVGAYYAAPSTAIIWIRNITGVDTSTVTPMLKFALIKAPGS